MFIIKLSVTFSVTKSNMNCLSFLFMPTVYAKQLSYFITILWAVRPWSRLFMLISRLFVRTDDRHLQWCRNTDYKHLQMNINKTVLSHWGTHIYTLFLRCWLVIFRPVTSLFFLIGSLISPCFNAVSYTHLDVYKRQTSGFPAL